ncbi:hypothetical protein [Methanobacterium petrolearium]|uniref:hypothetical protein n=1 Tax=Methanobacterium petrolearium TaxID=710190 RepID=UPI001AE70266|nr:hypothetical protein [Methanobacterium petrolearium]MBP1945199.1 hypothetical protein [Methanobacterium petrolearium]BDZ71130.1 hypothetical protein GCM10025861_16470 [Methanobacterium petrolearium]
MKLEISEAIPLILAIPAHRSQNEGHRKLGEKAIDLLFEYKNSASDTELKYNMAMIGAVLSTDRAFSVERDRITEKWKVVDYIKQRRERLLEMFQNISPFSSGNYWSKILVVLAAGGLSASNIILQGYQTTPYFFIFLVIFLLAFEFLSRAGEYWFSTRIEKSVPTEKLGKWEKEALTEYENILKFFIQEAVQIHLNYYPDEKKLYGLDLTDQESVNSLKDFLIGKHFYFKDSSKNDGD